MPVYTLILTHCTVQECKDTKLHGTHPEKNPAARFDSCIENETQGNILFLNSYLILKNMSRTVSSVSLHCLRVELPPAGNLSAEYQT